MRAVNLVQWNLEIAIQVIIRSPSGHRPGFTAAKRPYSYISQLTRHSLSAKAPYSVNLLNAMIELPADQALISNVTEVDLVIIH